MAHRNDPGAETRIEEDVETPATAGKLRRGDAGNEASRLSVFRHLCVFSWGAGILPAVFLALAGCLPDPAIHIRLNDDVEVPAKSVVIFFPDGMDLQRTEELLAGGRLPHIRERFVEGGVQVRTAMSCLPTVTYPNCSSLITGVFPGHHGILGNFWFERSTLSCRDYMTIPTYRTVNGHLRNDTLYHILADQFTVSIQNHTRNGATYVIDREVGFVWSLASGGYWYADRRVANRINEVADVANRVKRWPTVLMTYYPGVDSVGHIYGTNSLEYATVLENIDLVVGRVMKAFEEAGLADRTYFVLVADHGMVPTAPGQDFGLIRWLKKERGLRVRTTTIPETMDYPTRFKTMEPYDAVATVDAGRVGMIHIKGRRGWAWPPEPQEVFAWATSPPALHDLPAVEIVAIRDGPDRARAWGRRGSVTVERSGPLTDEKYRISAYEGDPLGYRDHPKAATLMDGGWHGSREWLAATLDTRCPDFVPQIVEMFDSPRTGDLVVFAADDWLLYPAEKAGHGSCLERDIHIPLFFAGPDLPRGAVVPCGRLVDVVPTILGLLDEADRLDRIEPIDGINLADQLRNASPRSSAAEHRHPDNRRTWKQAALSGPFPFRGSDGRSRFARPCPTPPIPRSRRADRDACRHLQTRRQQPRHVPHAGPSPSARRQESRTISSPRDMSSRGGRAGSLI